MQRITIFSTRSMLKSIYVIIFYLGVVYILTLFLLLLSLKCNILCLLLNRLLISIHCLYLFFISLLLLTPSIFNIINISLYSGIVPSSLKHAIIKPILKKPGLDIECLPNYRPISQLPFISKILEIIVSKQLINYLNSNSLFDTRQSAYRKFDSPETLLLSILDDFLNKLDNNSNIQLIRSICGI